MATRCYLHEIRFNAGHDADSTRRKQIVLISWVLADPTEVVGLVGVKVMHPKSVFISGVQIKELFHSRRIVLQLEGRNLCQAPAKLIHQELLPRWPSFFNYYRYAVSTNRQLDNIAIVLYPRRAFDFFGCPVGNLQQLRLVCRYYL
jgi:hypothetical protein